MNAGPVAAISMHQYAKMPWAGHFAGAEAIFRAHGGRQQWAKHHTLTRADVHALYPMAQRYRMVRCAAPPAGIILHHHLHALLHRASLSSSQPIFCPAWARSLAHTTHATPH